MKKVIFGLLALLIVGGAAAGMYYFIFKSDTSGLQATEESISARVGQDVFFYHLPEMLVNITGRDRKSGFLKLDIALEYEGDESVSARLDDLLPRIQDVAQTYIRSVNVVDLEGTAGILRLRRALFRRISLVIKPIKLRQVLFKNMVVQQ